MKDAMVQADAVTKQQVAATTGLAAGSAGKGLRGTASSSFDSSDTVQRNRDMNGGLARDASGKKVVAANRNRTPEELGLKQWTGS